MNVSAILVVVPAAEMDTAIRTLSSMTGIDVHFTDRETGRIIVTQEAGSIPDEIEGLKRIQALPDVTLAEMIQHHFEDDPEIREATSPEPRQREPAPVPPSLED
jgi:nitrate reductase NapD